MLVSSLVRRSGLTNAAYWVRNSVALARFRSAMQKFPKTLGIRLFSSSASSHRHTSPSMPTPMPHHKSFNLLYLTLGLLVGGVAHELFEKMTQPESPSTEDTRLIRLVLQTIKEEFPQMLPQGFTETDWWQELERVGYLQRSGEDKIWRPVFVGLQAAIEAALLLLHKKGEVKLMAHITQTDLPSSPLCEIDAKDMHPDIYADPARRNTVYARITVMANILQAQIPVVVYYSHDGLMRRSSEGQAKYKANRTNYPNLKDCPMQGKILPQDSGATVMFKSTSSPARGFFTIASLQATTLGNHWQLCLDSARVPRTNEADNLLEQRREFMILGSSKS
jgi:hypothetical protein